MFFNNEDGERNQQHELKVNTKKEMNRKRIRKLNLQQRTDKINYLLLMVKVLKKEKVAIEKSDLDAMHLDKLESCKSSN